MLKTGSVVVSGVLLIVEEKTTLGRIVVISKERDSRITTLVPAVRSISAVSLCHPARETVKVIEGNLPL